jgi:hypothetical protein
LIHTLKNQILSLVIDISTNAPENFMSPHNETIFTLILSIFTNLQYLNFGPALLSHQRLSFLEPPLSLISTNLLELYVCVATFTDCLYLLDGCFNQLRIFYVDIFVIRVRDETVDNTVDYFF